LFYDYNKNHKNNYRIGIAAPMNDNNFWKSFEIVYDLKNNENKKVPFVRLKPI